MAWEADSLGTRVETALLAARFSVQHHDGGRTVVRMFDTEDPGAEPFQVEFFRLVHRLTLTYGDESAVGPRAETRTGE